MRSRGLSSGILSTRDLEPGFDIASPLAKDSLVNVELPPSQVEFIHRKVADGEFTSAEAVISEGIKLLEQRERWKGETAGKIEEGWHQAKSGMLLAEKDLIDSLGARKSAWKAARER